MNAKRRADRGIQAARLLGAGMVWGWASAVRASGAGADLPAEAAPREEVLRVTKMVKPFFPRRALVEGARDGEAHVLFEVDGLGQIGDLMLLAYTRADFADAAVEAVRQWRFRPYLVDGKPVTTIMRVAFLYRAGEIVAVDTMSVPGPLPAPRIAGSSFIHEPCPATELDRPVRPLRSDPPLYPAEFSDRGLVGRVRVEFYIDAAGEVRFPLVVSRTHPLLASVVTAAVKEWRFDPPRRRGRPVLVFATQEFQFEPGP
ncbi:MAG TPA: TonB family protein [Opitutaceae bacterium]|nr:TonB family protein [Opitutaceae bacterium]